MAAALAKSVAENNPADVPALMATTLDGEPAEASRALVQSRRKHERPSFRACRWQGCQLHARRWPASASSWRIGNADIARDVAMHLAASVASTRGFASKDEVPAEPIENERKIFAAQAGESGKPMDIIAKMVEGRMHKYPPK